MNSISSKFQALLDYPKLRKVLEVSDILGINPNWLLATMYFETAKTLSPSKTNNIGSVGLIQFTRDKAGVEYKTIKGKKYLLSDIKKMSFEDQMDLVLAYYLEVSKGRRITSFVDCYLITFFPNAIGKPMNYVLSTKSLSAGIIAKQNPIFDANKDKQVTKAEVVNFFKNYYNKLGFDFDNDINKKASLGIVLPLTIFFYSLVSLFI